jgi:AraC family transcriptional regulator
VLVTHKILQSRSFDDLTIHATEYYAGGPTDVHSHKNARIVLILRGQFQEHFGRKRRDCSAGSLIFRPAGESHRERFLSKQSLCISLDIGLRWLARIRQDLIPQNPLYFQSPHLISISSRMARELQIADSFSHLVMESSLLEIFGLTIRNQFLLDHPHPSWLKRVVDLLLLSSDRLKVRELADEAGVHPVYLARIFRRYYGCTVGEYVRLIRIQQAQQDLLDSNEPIAEIAIKNGFADQSHFTRSFKHVTGVTPACYRNQRL